MDLISEFYDGARWFGYWSSPPRYAQQFRVYSRDDVIKYLNTWDGVMNCGISVCTYKGEVPIMMYLPFDFDSNSLDKSWDDASRFYNYMVDDGWDISMNFSGFRGFHCLVSLVPDFYTNYQIKETQKMYKRILNLKTCDERIFGDIRRLIRIPKTLHAGKFKRKNNGKWERIGEGGYCQQISYSKGNLMDLDDYYDDSEFKYNFNINQSNGYKPRHPYPCIDKALDTYINDRGLHEPPQLIRLSYVAYWLRMDKTPQEIYDMIEERYSDGKEHAWDDWNPEITAKQIEQISMSDRYYPLKCSSIKDMGFCLGSKCKYNFDDWFKKSSEVR